MLAATIPQVSISSIARLSVPALLSFWVSLPLPPHVQSQIHHGDVEKADDEDD
jgi:hypothetical protein